MEGVAKKIHEVFGDDIGINEYKEKEGITVEHLCLLCLNEIVKGNAQKHVQISMDDEGNGYHTLFYGFSPAEGFDVGDFHDDVKIDDIIVLG